MNAMRIITVVATCSLIVGPVAAADADRPNIVLILADDQGYGDVGCYGATDIKTPNIDRLAAEGTRFTSFYVAQPVCTASRTALLTGCYPNRLGMAGALNHTSTTGIHPKEVLLSNLAKSRGYATAIYGKWHLGHHPPFLPTRRGFDEFFGLPYSNDNGPLHPVTKGIPPLPVYEGENVVEVDPDQSKFTQRLTDRAVKFIEKNKDKPFFLYVPHIMPHVPIFASEKFKGTSKRGLYGDVVQELDWSVGEILAALKKHDLEKNTIVVYASDNGPFLSYGEHAGSAGKLREGKLTTFEGGVRVPGIIRWPERVPKDRVCDELFTTMDLFVCLTKFIGAKLPEAKIDGEDLTTLLLGEKNAKGRKTFFYYSGDELQAVRVGDWKLHLPHEYLTVAGEPGKGGKPSNFGKLKPESIELSGIRGIATRHGYRFESIHSTTYDLKKDPGEATPVMMTQVNVIHLQAFDICQQQAREALGDSLNKTVGKETRPALDIKPKLPDGVKTIRNLEYANPGGIRSLLLDLYLPTKEASKPLPVVMWIHGGGWSKGSKENCPLIWLVNEGYAVASLGYRLVPEAKWPTPLDDSRAAVRFLRSSTAKYKLDSNRIAVAGGSAGGTLASITGVFDALRDEAVSSQVQGVIDFYGASDLLTMPPNVPGPDKTDADLAKTNGARLIGGIVRDHPDLAKQVSPIYHISKSDPPFLIIHGDQDKQVPLEQSERLHAKLKAAGVPSALHVIKGAGHGGKEFDTPEVRKWIVDFLAEHVRK
jgi:arylsulfatase A